MARFDGMRRIPEHGVVAGVCAGIAEYFDWNVRLLRAVLVISFVISGFFPIVVAYCVLWYVMEPARVSSQTFDAPTRPAPSMGDIKSRFARLDERLQNIEECVTDREFDLRRELKKLET